MAQKVAKQSPYPEVELEKGRRRRRDASKSQKRGAPFLFRFLSWMGVVLLCFVLGYLGTSWLMDVLNKKILLKPENLVANQEELDALNEATAQKAAAAPKPDGSVQQIPLRLFYVREGSVAETGQNFLARAQEDNIKDAVKAVLSLSGVPGVDQLDLRHVFRNAETVYLDFPAAFASTVANLGQRPGLLLMTGIVRTMQANFPPIEQVRFLIDAKAPTSGGPVDLSLPWKMPSRS